MKNYEEFLTWLDEKLSNLPQEVVAVNFNLYEGIDDTYDIQLIGADQFDKEDDDWSCEEIFTTGEDIFYIARTNDIQDWEEGQAYISKMIIDYLQDGKYSKRLKELKAVGVGFVDGDIELIYIEE